MLRVLAQLAFSLLFACGGDDDGIPPRDGGSRDAGRRDGGAVVDGGGGPRTDAGCREGAVCTPADPCREGRMDCAPPPACVPTAPAAADTPCEGGTCDGLATCIRTETGAIVASDADRFDSFGTTVAIDGTRAIVGTGRPGPGAFADAAYVFGRDAGGEWAEEAILTTTDPTGGQFGVAVDISGGRVVVGSPNASHSGEPNAGAAYVFEPGAGGDWTQVARLYASDPRATQRFGRAVAIVGDRIVVGAFSNSGLAGDQGIAYVFERAAGGTWNEVGRLLASDGREGDGLGMSVDIDGDTMVAGAPFDDTSRGSVYVFTRGGSGTWTESGRLVAMTRADGDELGTSVSLDGDRLAVGAPFADDPGLVDAGAVLVFERPSGGAFAEVARLGASNHSPEDFLDPVALEGDLLVAGAPGFDRVGRRAAGQAFLYERASDGTWTFVESIYAMTPMVDDLFGSAVALSGTVALIGAPGMGPDVSSEAGAVLFFDPIR